MSKVPPKYRPDHPFRAVDWRWQYANIIVENGEAIDDNLKNDMHLNLAIEFCRSLRSKNKDLDIGTLYEQYPVIYPAWEIYDEGLYRKSELEARILGSESFDSIASKMNLSVPQVVAYESIFFNVIDRLNNKSYIFHNVLGFNHEQVHRDVHLRWKLLGYCAGYEILDKIIYLDLNLTIDENELDDTIFRELQTKLIFKLKFGDHYNMTYWKLIEKLLSSYVKLLSVRKRDAKVAEIDEAFTYLKNALQNMDWSRVKYAVASSSDILAIEDLRKKSNE